MSDMLEEIYQLQHELNLKVGVDSVDGFDKKKWLFPFTHAMHDEVQELSNCVHWKWWSKDVKANPDLMLKGIKDEGNAKIEAIDILHFLISIFQILDMTPEDILEVYRLKHGANMKRQDVNYDIETKNEDDNEEIIRRVS